MVRTVGALIAAAAMVIALPAVAETAEDGAGETILERVGYAYSRDRSTLLYTEHHFDRFQGETLVSSEVRYRDAEERLFAGKRLDFGATPLMPEFELRDRDSGHFESAERRNGALAVTFRHPRKDDRQVLLEDPPANGVVDAGFDRWIEQNWDDVVAGRALKRPFLVPSAGRFLDFSVRQSEVREEDGVSVRILKMEPASFLLRLAVEPIEVVYRADAPVLLRYTGLSNMRDSEGRNRNVVIEFPEQERRRYDAPASGTIGDAVAGPPQNGT